MICMVDPAEQSGITARMEGVCAWCGESIIPWEHTIRKIKGRGWLHGECAGRADELERVAGEHEEVE